MTASITAKIDTQADAALAAYESAKGAAADLAASGTATAEDWARFANSLAETEGKATAWAQIQATVRYFEREGLELTDAAVLETIVEILSRGADDVWSGRANDVRRARFDGVRNACTTAKYLVTV